MQLFQTPRVNGAVLGLFVGRTVAVVGKVVSHQEGAAEAELETSVSNTILYHYTAVLRFGLATTITSSVASVLKLLVGIYDILSGVIQ